MVQPNIKRLPSAGLRHQLKTIAQSKPEEMETVKHLVISVLNRNKRPHNLN